MSSSGRTGLAMSNMSPSIGGERCQKPRVGARRWRWERSWRQGWETDRVALGVRAAHLGGIGGAGVEGEIVDKQCWGRAGGQNFTTG